jgi:hypothetical protein
MYNKLSDDIISVGFHLVILGQFSLFGSRSQNDLIFLFGEKTDAKSKALTST